MSLVLVCNPSKKNCSFLHFDSLLSSTESEEQRKYGARWVGAFLAAEWARAELGDGPDFAKIDCVNANVLLAQQNNGVDCGVFVLYFAEHVVDILSRLVPNTNGLDVSQLESEVEKIRAPNMALYRLRLIELLFSDMLARYKKKTYTDPLKSCIDAVKKVSSGLPSFASWCCWCSCSSSSFEPPFLATMFIKSPTDDFKHSRKRGVAIAATPMAALPTTKRQTRAATTGG